MKAESLDDDYFIKNAILCWLHYFPEHKWTDIYKELAQRETYTKGEPVAKPRPARRRKPKPSQSSAAG